MWQIDLQCKTNTHDGGNIMQLHVLYTCGSAPLNCPALHVNCDHHTTSRRSFFHR
jgi:hypothetical protein